MSETIKWSALTPEQRDALLAEKVMGLKIEHWTDETYKDADPAYCYVKGYVVINEPGSISHWSPVPRFSQSMDDAWLVIKHLDEELDGYHLILFMDEMKKLVIDEVVSNDWDEDGITLKGLANLTPDKLCRSALVARDMRIAND